MGRISQTIAPKDKFFEDLCDRYNKYEMLQGVRAHIMYDRDCVTADGVVVCLIGNNTTRTFSDIAFVVFDSNNLSEKTKEMVSTHSYLEKALTDNYGIVYGVQYFYTFGITIDDIMNLKEKLTEYLCENTNFFKSGEFEVIKSYQKGIDEFKEIWSKKNMI